MPVASESISYHHGNVREALLDAAWRRITEQEHADVSLSELARSVGITPAAVYRHFADKQALLDAVAALAFDRLEDAFKSVAPHLEGKAMSKAQARLRFERLAQAYFDFGMQHPGVFQLMFGSQGKNHRSLAQARTEPSPSFAYLQQGVEDLRAVGLTRRTATPHNLWVCWSLIHGATQLAISGSEAGIQPKPVGKAVADALIAFLNGAAEI